jgi:hypothetical protein
MAIRVQRREPAWEDGRSLDARAANDRIAEKAKRLQFHSRVPMVCECSRLDCHTIIMVSLHEYQEIRAHPDNFLIAPGHDLDGSRLAKTTAKYETRRQPRKGNGDRRSA